MQNINVQAMDALQYFYSFKHEPLIRAVMTFSGHLDASVLKKAVDLSTQAVPVIQCRFDITKNRPVWRYENGPSDNIVHLVETEKAPEQFAVSVIDFFAEPQLKIYLLRNHTADTLVVISNHMICDGTGFQNYLYLLARLYTTLQADASYTEMFDTTDRSLAPLMRSLSFKEKIKMLFLHSALGKQKNDIALSFTGDSTSPFIVTQRITSDTLAQAKAYAKHHNVTFNDIFMTAYIRMIGKETGHDRIILPCPVDLRKFISHQVRWGYPT